MEMGQKVRFSTYLVRKHTKTADYRDFKHWDRVSRPETEGMVIGKRRLSNGFRSMEFDYDEYRGKTSSWWEFDPTEVLEAYLVVFDFFRNPVYVLPEDLERVDIGSE